MPDVIDDDDTDALAAEFVLGTLDADERTHANLLLDIDDDFRGKVRVWERRLGELHLMVEPVEPAPQIWERIKAKIEGGARRPVVEPELPKMPEPEEQEKQKADEEQKPDIKQEEKEPDEKGAETAATLETTLDALEAELRRVGLPDGAPEEALDRAPELIPDRVVEPETERSFNAAGERPRDAMARARRAARDRPAPYLAQAGADQETLRPALRRWRAFAVMMMVLVVAVGGLLAAWRYAPERLPPQLSVYSLLKVPTPPPPPPPKPKAPPESQFDE